MTKKNRGLLVSIVAGVIAIVLLLVVLLLHAFAPAAASETAADHPSQAAPTPSTAHTPETMVMPDGSVMYMDDMGSSTATTAAGAGQTMVMPDGSVMNADDMEHSMGGSIDWEVIGLILALIATCISLGTALNAYLRRQMTDGALLQGGAANG